MNLGGGIGWKFPLLDGGEGQGFEHAGMAHFQGDLLGSLAREVIQNSLDAGLDGKTVEMTFELRDIDIRKHLDGDQLRRHIEACHRVCVSDDRTKAADFFAEAAKLLERRVVPFLCISDRNTTGLPDAEWKALVKRQGDSAKRDTTSGGSYGIGKNAPFAVSPLRTVGYWTCLDEDGELVEKFQAKAILMSHDWPVNGGAEETHGSGFFGLTDRCRELRNRRIPRVFRMRGNEGTPIGGTAVWIAGFRTEEAWQRGVARSVLRNYFYAIERRRLDVVLEPDESREAGGEYADLRNETLERVFDGLLEEDDGAADGSRDAYTYWRMTRDGAKPRFEEDLPGLGKVKLWVETEDERPGEELPGKVALIRGTGMLVTDNQPGLMRFPSLRDFAAVCVFETPEANELLRQMENPAHDRFEPDRLPPDCRKHGRDTLRGLTGWIRKRLDEVAAPAPSSVSEELDELARFLPLDGPGPLDGGQGGEHHEKQFGVTGVVLRKAPKRRVQPSGLESDADEDNEAGDGDEAGHGGGAPVGEGGGGQGPGGGPGDGPGRGGTGPRDGPLGGAAVRLYDVRILAEDASGRQFRVWFTPGASGRARLALEEAGDTAARAIPGVRFIADNGREVTTGLSLKENRRRSLHVRSPEALTGAALRLIASSGSKS